MNSTDTKHTPGPWEVQVPCSSELTCRNIRGPKGEHVAKVGWMDYSEGQAIDLANARLIAAAPTMASDLGIVKVLLLQGQLQEALNELSKYDISFPDGAPVATLLQP